MVSYPGPMSELRPGTKSSEHESEVDPETVGALIYVLCYDDLLGPTLALPPLGRGVRRLDLRRDPDQRRLHVHEGVFFAPDPYMSAEHARIERRGQADVLKDLRSRHGTFVNGARIANDDEKVLEDGDIIEVGHSLLCYRRRPLDPDGRIWLASRDEGARLGLTKTRAPEGALLASRIHRFAATEEPIIIFGERGTGKEGLALQIHEESGRPGPFHALDCGAVTGSLFESELFGHAHRAFNEAKARLGAIRTAHRGTLLLDEIANLDLAQQDKLLRAIQVKKVHPVGADTPLPFDVRWLGATNRGIDDDDIFLPDLRDRLAGFRAILPPLRRRLEDLGTLVPYLLKEAGVKRAAITKRAARALFAHSFPGNVRQLDKVLRAASILAGGDTIDLPHLVSLDSEARLPEGTTSPDQDLPVAVKPAERRARPERGRIIEVLEETGGNQGAAARLLGVHEKQLRRWMDMLGIERAGKKKD